MQLTRVIETLKQAGPILGDAAARGNVRVLASMLGPAYRGLVLQRAKGASETRIEPGYQTHFDWQYRRDFPEVSRLYEAAKTSQWNATKDISWSTDVDPYDTEEILIPDHFHPASTLPVWRKLSVRERADMRHSLMSWMLSQFLHGEQGALYAASQVTEAVPWLDAKLYGSTQVVDEGRHVEAFHTYLHQKLGRVYEINDNLYVVIDALISDSRWDVKFLGMQIMIEGLALGSFGMIRKLSKEPLLREVLKYVITDEARHVHFGVLALERFYATELTEKELREREQWAFEVTRMLRDRFLMHELYDEYFGHSMKRAEWDRLLLESDLMTFFRQTMFKRIIPNLKRVGLLNARVRGRYEKLGLLDFEHGRSAGEVPADELLGEQEAS